jgi:two-component system chemotaxis sensor kinase CheA
MVIVRTDRTKVGLLVDRLHGQHQTVIKPLGRMFRSLRGMSGSSILGNGEVALIFDVTALCQLAEHPPPRSRTAPGSVTRVTSPNNGQTELNPSHSQQGSES